MDIIESDMGAIVREFWAWTKEVEWMELRFNFRWIFQNFKALSLPNISELWNNAQHTFSFRNLLWRIKE